MKLLVMSFDGESKLERPKFVTVPETWDYANNLGSRWWFYPFNFVVSDSGKTVQDTPYKLEFLKGWRTSTVKKMFAAINDKLSKGSTAVDEDEFVDLLVRAFCSSCRKVHLEDINVPRTN